MAVIDYSPKQGVLGTRQAQRARHVANQGRANTMPLAEIAARLSAQENALTTKAIGGVLGLVNQAREYDYPDTALGWASLPAKALAGIAGGMTDIPGEMIDDANNQVAGLSDGRKVTEGLLGLLTMSPLATAPAGAIRIFAGRNAKTADLDALARAEKMLADGADRGQVWNKTGWFKDVDGNMKFEIDDQFIHHRLLNHPDTVATKAKDRVSLMGAKQGDVLSHKDLFAAYPDLSEIDFSASTSPGGARSGQYIRDLDEISINGKNIDDITSVNLHELQHAIQRREGFASGGNQGDAVSALLADRNAELSQISKAMDARQKEIGLGDMYRPKTDDPILLQLRQRYDYLQKTNPATDDAAYDWYKRLAGEAEARNVQTRMNYTPEQRRATPPWATLDVPEDELIVRRK
jgi:hypothetical protein